MYKYNQEDVFKALKVKFKTTQCSKINVLLHIIPLDYYIIIYASHVSHILLLQLDVWS